MSHAIRFHTVGGPDVLHWEKVGVGATDTLAPHEARVRHHAIGVNYIDIYHRTGLYPTPLPSGIGLEAAGVVEAVGGAVSEVQVGDRVAYAGGPLGAYAEVRAIAADRLVKLPDSIDFATAAATMLKGLTVQYLLRRTYRVQRGDTLLVHAAAGGVGSMLCQWAKTLGATVIGIVGSAHKAELALAHGCDHVVLGAPSDWVAQVKALTQGRGVRVAYDSVGKDTFMGSLDCLQPLGMMVSFGNASGPVPPFDLGELARRGSLFVTRPSLMTYTAQRSDLLAMSAELFELVAGGQLKVDIRQQYALRDAALAQTELEARKTTGATILLP